MRVILGDMEEILEHTPPGMPIRHTTAEAPIGDGTRTTKVLKVTVLGKGDVLYEYYKNWDYTTASEMEADAVDNQLKQKVANLEKLAKEKDLVVKRGEYAY